MHEELRLSPIQCTGLTLLRDVNACDPMYSFAFVFIYIRIKKAKSVMKAYHVYFEIRRGVVVLDGNFRGCIFVRDLLDNFFSILYTTRAYMYIKINKG